MSITNLSKNTILAKKVVLADTFFSRLKGLLGRDALGNQEALIIKPANSIHTFFMRFPIDLIFLDKQNRVTATKESIKPFRLTSPFLNAFSVIELPTNTIKNTQTQVGDILQLET